MQARWIEIHQKHIQLFLKGDYFLLKTWLCEEKEKLFDQPASSAQEPEFFLILMLYGFITEKEFKDISAFISETRCNWEKLNQGFATGGDEVEHKHTLLQHLILAIQDNLQYIDFSNLELEKKKQSLIHLKESKNSFSVSVDELLRERRELEKTKRHYMENLEEKKSLEKELREIEIFIEKGTLDFAYLFKITIRKSKLLECLKLKKSELIKINELYDTRKLYFSFSTASNELVNHILDDITKIEQNLVLIKRTSHWQFEIGKLFIEKIKKEKNLEAANRPNTAGHSALYLSVKYRNSMLTHMLLQIGVDPAENVRSRKNGLSEEVDSLSNIFCVAVDNIIFSFQAFLRAYKAVPYFFRNNKTNTLEEVQKMLNYHYEQFMLLLQYCKPLPKKKNNGENRFSEEEMRGMLLAYTWPLNPNFPHKGRTGEYCYSRGELLLDYLENKISHPEVIEKESAHILNHFPVLKFVYDTLKEFKTDSFGQRKLSKNKAQEIIIPFNAFWGIRKEKILEKVKEKKEHHYSVP